ASVYVHGLHLPESPLRRADGVLWSVKDRGRNLRGESLGKTPEENHLACLRSVGGERAQPAERLVEDRVAEQVPFIHVVMATPRELNLVLGRNRQRFVHRDRAEV